LAIRRLVVLFALLLEGGFLYSAAPLPCASAAQYRALLGQVEQRSAQPDVSLAELADTVPAQCNFVAGGRAFHFSNLEMQRELRELAAKPDNRIARLKMFQGGLLQRLSGIDAYERRVDPTAKPKLQEIMQRREFRRVGKQDPMALLQEWMFQILEKLFSRIFRDPSRVVLGAKTAAWSLCIAVAGFILWKLYRWAMQGRPPEAVREVIPFAPSAKSWRDWLREARAAVARGELREAVHAGYWAAISHLESSGAWRPDRARTPREYLRLLAQSDPSRALLADITRDFEVVWYGNRPPAFTEWESFLAKVERIGCR
jgi:Domain of unknown function (DUF4129)